MPELSCWEDIDKRDKDIKVSSEGLSDKASQTTTMDTNNVDREIEKLKNKKAQLEQQLYSVGETKKKELEQEINDELGNFDSLIIDFTELKYISSAGLRVLIATQKKLQQENIPFVIKNVNDAVGEIFRMSGFDKILKIE